MAAVADSVQSGQIGDGAANSIVALTSTASGPPPQSNTCCTTPLSTVHHTGTTHQPVYDVTGVKRESPFSTNEAVQSKMSEDTTPQQSQVLVTGTSSESQSVVLATPDGRILKIPQHLMTASSTTGGVPMNSIALIDAGGTKLLVAPTPVASSQYSSMSTGCVQAPQASVRVPTSTAERPEVATPDSNSPKLAYMLCKVCGDKASGYHYGVTSCEGCKGFFRRSIQKRIEYRCLRDGNCVVIRLNRNRCQHCRFKKCLAVGMSRDCECPVLDRIMGHVDILVPLLTAVRYGRMGRKGSSSSISESSSNSENEQLAIYDIILNISQAHHSNCAYTEDRLKSLQKISASLLPVGREDESPESQRLVMWQDLANRITATIQRVVEFAKRVPGFAQIAQDDQLILIKAGFFELWLLRLSRTINSKNQVVMFEDGGCIPLHQLEIVLTPELVKSMVDFTDGLAALALNDTEIGLISSIVLSTSDRPNLLNPPEVEKIQTRLIGALKLQLSRNHGDEENLFSTILMRLPELRAIGLAHNDQLQTYRQHWEILTVPPLFSEIYDIPKNEVVEATV